ncbi:MAG: LruC domain-containing protein [Colwellia sp.]|nr:LruC domain-containing protein [Colwellia sp.]
MNKLYINYFCYLMLALIFTFASYNKQAFAVSPDSVRLKDTIKQGVGLIDVFKGQGNTTISAAEVEQFRLDNISDSIGYLVFGVDVNEAASGSEIPTSQGVAIASLALTVTRNGVETVYDVFSTQTQSMLAVAGQDNKTPYYTLIGHTGSNNIVGSGLNGTSIDAILKIRVDDDLADASAIELSITLLETNSSLGDPEAYYDFTNGFEDLALVNLSDANFLNEQASGRDEAPLVVLTAQEADTVASLYWPSSTNYYVVAYEDEFPNKGDYDLNDLVVAYQVEFGLNSEGLVKTIKTRGYLVARGGLYNHDWHLRIPLQDGSHAVGQFSLFSPPDSTLSNDSVNSIDVTDNLDIKVFSNTRTLFVDPLNSFVNTSVDSSIVKGDKFNVYITLDTPLAIAQIGPAPFDPYLLVHSTGYEIHLSGQSPVNDASINILNDETSFVDEMGYPFAFIIPEGWQTPTERVDVGTAYPELLNYIQSGKTESLDWYLNPGVEYVHPNSVEQWKW